jgi:Protein of unknown function (DUF1329)
MIRDEEQEMGRPDSKMFACLTFWLAFLIGSTNVIAQVNSALMKASGATPAAAAVPASPSGENGKPDAAMTDTIAPGTVITMQNWQQYKQFMPDGMVWLFGGQYFWKMPSDVRMEVGPTIIHPLPKTYMEATERYSAQVKVVENPDGGLNVAGYQGGIPFPTPAEPHKGWKILANLWFRYVPHISVDPYGAGCELDSFGSINCQDVVIVYRQLSYNTDPGVPATIPGGEGKFFTQYLEFVTPEQLKYTANLRISWTDLSHLEDAYLFVPARRNYQRLATAARCSTQGGSDSTPDDGRGGYDVNMTQVKVDFLGEKKILTLQDITRPAGTFPQNFDMPLGWPTPSWGKWQVRDAYVLSVSKLPAYASGYCYARRVMYVDKNFYGVLWDDLYDNKDQPWKILGVFRPVAQATGIGPVSETLNYVQGIWDLQHEHATFFTDPVAGQPFYLNEQAPANYLDLSRYTRQTGLTMIMR